MSKKELKLPPTGEGRVKKWLECRLAIKKMEPLYEALRPHVEKFLQSSAGQTCQVGTSTLSLSEVARLSFNVKKAEEVLGKDALAPFWEASSHNRINVK